MIAGPILPRNADSLWRLVREDPDQIEQGLRLVRGELALESGVAIDSIAADAAGRAVLVFVATLEEDQKLPGRVAEARAWFQRNARMLDRVLAADGLDLSPPIRALVIGFDFTATCLDRLRDLADDGLSVLRVEGFRLEGELHVGVQPLLATERAVQTVDAFALPPTLTAGTDDAVFDRFLELLRRLDPDLRATGDRYSRQWHLPGGMVCELARLGGEVQVRVPGGTGAPLHEVDDVTRAFDPILRRYLAVQNPDESAIDSLAEDGLVIEDAPLGASRLPQFGDASITSEEYDAFLQEDG